MLLPGVAGIQVALTPVERNDLALSGQRAGPMEVSGRKHWEQGILCLQSQHSSDRGGGL